jgi:hypothetical protein
MAIRPATKIPTRVALDFGDRVLVDIRDTTFHQPFRGELPILVAAGTKPVAAVVMIFMDESHRVRLPACAHTSLIRRQSSALDHLRSRNETIVSRPLMDSARFRHWLSDE